MMGSYLLHTYVPVEVARRVMPECSSLADGDVLQPLHDHVPDVVEGAFPSRQSCLIDLVELQGTEQKLDRRSRVAVRPRMDNRDPQLLDDGPRVSCSMIRSIVLKNYRPLFPPWCLTM